MIIFDKKFSMQDTQLNIKNFVCNEFNRIETIFVEILDEIKEQNHSLEKMIFLLKNEDPVIFRSVPHDFYRKLILFLENAICADPKREDLQIYINNSNYFIKKIESRYCDNKKLIEISNVLKQINYVLQQYIGLEFLNFKRIRQKKIIHSCHVVFASLILTISLSLLVYLIQKVFMYNY